MMKNCMKLFMGILLTVCYINSVNGQNADVLYGLVARIAPWASGKVIVNFKDTPGTDKFELSTSGGKLVVNASNTVSACVGFNYYLNNYCHQMVSHCGNNILPKYDMPEIKGKISQACPFEYRYALNYCTFNYSFSFYDWSDWEKEIDWMALHGVNLMLAINGTEIIWKNTLQQFGFSEKEILDFIPGPSYTAWWLMGNIEGWGGPVTENMINKQMMLEKKILQRLREFGIKPVLQGFYGMIPNSLMTKYPKAKILEQGDWSDFKRPAYLLPEDSLFIKMSDEYYKQIKSIYGGIEFFGGDPFHEGGKSDEVNVSLSGKIIQQQMLKNFPKSTWVLQGWLTNPTKELLKDLNKKNTLVINLCGESNRAWEETNAFYNIPWIWGSINNFGETPAMHGRLQYVINEPKRAMTTAQGKLMKGIGIIPEGIFNNPLYFYLSLNNAWVNSVKIDSLTDAYTVFRYGADDKNIKEAYKLLLLTVYDSLKGYGAESVFAARPSKIVKSTSEWGSRKITYNEKQLEEALIIFNKSSQYFQNSSTYKYDLTDIARQVLDNRGQHAYDSLMFYFNKKDSVRYQFYRNEFIKLINLQDRLLSSNSDMLLGKWMQRAKRYGDSDYEKKLCERFAKMLITLWGPDNNPKEILHEYAFKEWGGLIHDLYIPRWEAFFKSLDSELRDNKSISLDFFNQDLKWVNGDKQYDEIAVGDNLEIVNELISDNLLKK